MSEIPNDKIIKKNLENGVNECVIWLQSLKTNQNVRSLKSACLKTFRQYQSLNKNSQNLFQITAFN